MQTLIKKFGQRKKRNIIKLKGAAKIFVLWLEILRQFILIRLTKVCIKLSIIIITKKNVMPKIILKHKLTP